MDGMINAYYAWQRDIVTKTVKVGTLEDYRLYNGTGNWNGGDGFDHFLGFYDKFDATYYFELTAKTE